MIWGIEISSLGQALLLTSLIVSFIGSVGGFYFLRKAPLAGLAFSKINLGFLVATITGCMALLLLGFIQTDLSLKTVAMNSANIEPLIYKISALWSNHEGSLLLWIFTLVGYGFIFSLTRTAGVTATQKTIMLIIFHMILFGFVLFMVWLSNPFETLAVTPHKGLGLNPLLHDPSMTFHPPSLYFGYIGFIIPFVMSLGLCLKPIPQDKVLSIVKSLQFWTYLPWAFLTFGITAGSLWAYYELGWGGYWAWDPVENASLLPWLSATAATHALVRLKHHPKSRGKMLLVLLTAAASWLLSLLGTYITRSGVVASVHGFAQDEDRGLFLLVFLGVLTGLTVCAIGIYIWQKQKQKQKYKQSQDYKTMMPKSGGSSLLNRSFLSLVYILVLGFVTLFLIIVSLAPVVLGGTYDESFYNQFLVPIGLGMLLMMAMVNLVTWEGVKSLWTRFRSQLIGVNIGLAVMALIMYGDTFKAIYPHIWGAIGAGFASWLIVSTLQVWRRHKTHVMHVAHLGFAVMVLAVSLNAIYKEDKHFWLHQNDSGFVGKYEFLYSGVQKTEGEHYDQEQAVVDVINIQGEVVATLTPQTRLYHTQEVLVSKTSIQRRYFSHVYGILGPELKSKERSIRILYQPFVEGIWLGGLLMTLAGIMAMFRRARNLKRNT